MAQFTTEVPVEKVAPPNYNCPILQMNTDCKTMEPQKFDGNRKMVVCEHVDRFKRQPTGPHTPNKEGKKRKKKSTKKRQDKNIQTAKQRNHKI